MVEEKSKKEIFKDSNERKRMDKVYNNLSPSTSFAEMKKHSQEFQEINARLSQESKKRKEIKDLRKQKIIDEKIEGKLFDAK